MTEIQYEKKRMQLALRRLYNSDFPNKEILTIIGIDKLGYIDHINKYLLDGMTKENFGKIWSLDHIVPVGVFDLTNEDDRLLCYNYNNIMPMFNNDNRMKGSSIHFSLAKLQAMYTNVVIEKLKTKCQHEIEGRYNKYLTLK